jgi:hypothetical protein
MVCDGFYCYFLSTCQINYQGCRNPSFGFATKARANKGAGPEWSSGVTFHVFGSVRKCEGMNPHTPK